MRIELQGWTPYQESLYWEVHDRYFRSRGLEAWTKGEMPQFGSSNFGAARQCAELLVSLRDAALAAGELAEDDPFVVLEVGGGTGTFAIHVHDALDHDLGEPGRALAQRLRYLWSDYAENTVRQAAAQPAMAALIDAGRLEPRLFDLRQPEGMTRLDGSPVADAAHAVLANYLVCVLPTRYLQHRGGGWEELWVRVYLDVEWRIEGGGDPDPADVEALKQEWLASAVGEGMMRTLQCDQDWRALAGGDAFEGSAHRSVIDGLHEGHRHTTVAYPYGFLDFLRTLGGPGSVLVPGGHVLVADYGHASAAQLHRASDRSSQIFGNSIAHGVNFGCLSAWAAQAGWGFDGSADPTRSVHVGLLRCARPLAPEVRSSFRRIEVERTDGEDLLDFWAASRRARDAGSPREALRMLLRCVDLDPRSPSLRYEVGVSAVDSGFPELAVEHLARGQELDVDGVLDFEFERGRAATELGQEAVAADWFTRALAREDHPTTWCNLAAVRKALGEVDAAADAARRAIALRPDYPRAHELLAELGAAPSRAR
jgi:tetratricopeptide (TPR) repeat protein